MEFNQKRCRCTLVLTALLMSGATAMPKGHLNNSNKIETVERRVISNGNPVIAGTYPWFARPKNKKDQEYLDCGGNLISREYILTTRACIEDGTSPEDIKFMIGALCEFENNCNQEVVERDVIDFFIDPEGNSDSMVLVRLSDPVPPAEVDYVDIDVMDVVSTYPDRKTNLWAMGFGYFGPNSSFSTNLLHTSLEYLNNNDCESSVDPEEMCAIDFTNIGSVPQSTCVGDDGGPLFDEDANRLVGIAKVANTDGCGEQNTESVFYRVAPKVAWMKLYLCNTRTHNEPLPRLCATEQPSMTPSVTPTLKPSLLTPSPTRMPSSRPTDWYNYGKGKGKKGKRNDGFGRYDNLNPIVDVDGDNDAVIDGNKPKTIIVASSVAALGGAIIAFGVFMLSRYQKKTKHRQMLEEDGSSAVSDDIYHRKNNRISEMSFSNAGISFPVRGNGMNVDNHHFLHDPTQIIPRAERRRTRGLQNSSWPMANQQKGRKFTETAEIAPADDDVHGYSSFPIQQQYVNNFDVEISLDVDDIIVIDDVVDL